MKDQTYDFLVIDDSAGIRGQIRAILGGKGMARACHEAADGLQGFRILTQNRVDLILCDLVMPQFDGFKFLHLKESRAEFRDIPVIILTSLEGIEQKVKGLEAGAADYIVKPFAPEELLARVRVLLKMKNLQEELREANERLRILSLTDELTGIFNRRHLMDVFGREMERTKRYRRWLAFLLADLDHFKRVNDIYGHQAGDEVLRRIGGLLRATLRSSDVVARYGGEEIAVIAPETDAAGAVVLAERMRKAVHQLDFTAEAGNFTITVSIGFTVSSGEESTDEVIKRADEALYRAKDLGRDRVEAIQPSPPEEPIQETL